MLPSGFQVHGPHAFQKEMEATHEPSAFNSGRADFHVGPEFQGAGETAPSRFMVPMQAQKRKEAFHEPERGQPCPREPNLYPDPRGHDCPRSCPFMVPMRGRKPWRLSMNLGWGRLGPSRCFCHFEFVGTSRPHPELSKVPMHAQRERRLPMTRNIVS